MGSPRAKAWDRRAIGDRQWKMPVFQGFFELSAAGYARATRASPS